MLLAAALLQAWLSGWAAAWQVRHWGHDSPVLSFLPGFAVLAAPVVVLQILPRRPDRPFLCGAQDALAPGRAGPVCPLPPERMARILLRGARGGLAAAALFALAGGLGFALVTRVDNRGAGAPLQELSFAAAPAPGRGAAPGPPAGRRDTPA